MFAANPKIQHGVEPDTLVRLHPHKLGRHYHKVPQHISETAYKYPRLIPDHFLGHFRINLDMDRVTVHERAPRDPDCIFRSPLGKSGFAIGRGLLAEAVECYYGGKIVAGQGEMPLSTSEQRLRERLGRSLVGLFARAILGGEDPGKLQLHDDTYDRPHWSYVVDFALTSHLTGESASLQLFFDEAIGDHLITRMAQPVTQTAALAPERAIERLPVRLECVLASMQVPLSQVGALEPGDILMLRMRERCEVRINREKLFEGQIFEQDGALCLTSLESTRTS